VVSLAHYRVDVLQPLFTQLAAIDEELIPLLRSEQSQRSDDLAALRLSLHNRITEILLDAQSHGVSAKEIAESLGVHTEVLRPWMHRI